MINVLYIVITLVSFVFIPNIGYSVAKSVTSKKFYSLRKEFRKGKINDDAMWDKLAIIHKNKHKLKKKEKIDLLLLTALLLYRDKFYLSASLNAAQIISQDLKLENKKTKVAWKILYDSSKKNPMQNLLELVARKTKEQYVDKTPYFKTDWRYFKAHSLLSQKKNKQAEKYFRKIASTSRYYFPAKYQIGLMSIDNKKYKAAESNFKKILLISNHNKSPINKRQKEDFVNRSYLALGRLAYERQEFTKSIKMYRSVSKSSDKFYDALFEQSWAFFMNGYVKQSLGALYAVESPFYKQVYNPEARILRGIVHYWLCRYDDSRNAIADFLEKDSPKIKSLISYLDRKNISSETAYQLFENYISGVSEEALLVSKEVLETASTRDSLLFLRDQYATILTELSRMKKRGVYNNKKGTETSIGYLSRLEDSLRADLGVQFLVELKKIHKSYETMESQAQFLYLELLMSQKDKMMGKEELHADNKIKSVSKGANFKRVTKSQQSWTEIQRGEYWWDAVGYYITNVNSQCKK